MMMGCTLITWYNSPLTMTNQNSRLSATHQLKIELLFNFLLMNFVRLNAYTALSVYLLRWVDYAVVCDTNGTRLTGDIYANR